MPPAFETGVHWACKDTRDVMLLAARCSAACCALSVHAHEFLTKLKHSSKFKPVSLKPQKTLIAINKADLLF
jgi:hypothetical protein